MENHKVVVSKKLGGAAVQVRVYDATMGMSINLSEFLSEVSDRAYERLAEKYAEQVGNPTFLVTNAQVLAKMSTVDPVIVRSILYKAANEIIDDMKSLSVVAK